MLSRNAAAYAPHLPPVFAAMNRAGSVGKTSIGWNLCVQAALRGWRGLFIDADLQSDASFWSGWDGDQLPDEVITVHDVMLGTHKLREAIVPARTRVAPGDDPSSFKIIQGLELVRGSEEMSQADSELAGDPKGVFWLQRALRRELAEGDYDYVWIDCPASLGLLSISLVIAATDIMVCAKPGRKELRGSVAMVRRIEEIRTEYEDFGASAVASWYAVNESKKHESQGKFYMGKQEEAAHMFGDQLLPLLRSATVVTEAYDAQEPLAFWVPNHESTQTIESILDKMGFENRLAA